MSPAICDRILATGRINVSIAEISSPGAAEQEGRVLPPHPEQPHLSRRVISVSNPVFRVTAAIHVRKCRCTFVKFHRQTAPAGPGHNTVRPNGSVSSTGLVSMPSASTSRLPIFPPQPEDDFILGPPPTGASAGGVHTMAETLYNSNSFAFPALYPTDPQPSLGGADPVDYASKYRAQAQAELFGPGRSGLGTGLTPLYDPRGGASASTGAAGWLGWDSAPQQQQGDGYHGHHQQQHHQEHGRHTDMIPASSGASAMHDKHLLQQQQQQQPPPPHYMPMAIPYPGARSDSGVGPSASGTSTSGGAGASVGVGVGGDADAGRRRSIDFTSDFGGTQSSSSVAGGGGAGGMGEYEYDYDYERFSGGSVSDGDGERDGSASVGARRSVQSSAASSSVHLPLGVGVGVGVGVGGVGGMGGLLQHQQQQQQQHGLGQSQIQQHQQHQQRHHQHQHQNEQRQHQQQQQQQRQHQHQQALFDAGYNLGLIPDRPSTASTSSSSSSHQPHHSRGGSFGDGGGSSTGGYAPSSHDERQEFSSAFGLMSLDDPNVIAGLAVDGQPFFSDPEHAHNQQAQAQAQARLLGQDMDTPMPMKQESSAGGLLQLPLDTKLQTPSRDTDTRELREFWKQYMRTPLSGPGPVLGMGDVQGGTSSKGTTTPYRRQRVASMPSVKTPVMERDHFYSEKDHQQQQQQQTGANVNAGESERDRKMGPTSSMRTTLHGDHEDLRSYEAAVLARKAPTNLNLQIRKPFRGRGNAPNNYGARPRSAVDPPTTSISSSLANAFGNSSNNTAASGSTGQQQQHVPPSAPPGRVSFAVKKEDSTSPSIAQSRGSSVAVEDSDGGSSNDQDSGRPSFKRLPSQTLGPANSKRAFLGFTEGNVDGAKDRQLIGWGTPNAGESTHLPAPKNQLSTMSHPDRVVASLSERRRRRMSAPGASAPLHLPMPDANANPIPIVENKGPERPYAGNTEGGATYAPAAQGGGRN
ncbi:hypothetical protein JR316_0006532 [Psilocybe cubensis]|uniref:Uncharacterized protein n=1 Tax=Psilocybe cubensis TaxID=181762 RepID=A0ACB8H2T2_PSICU|nr:hypothetical protein JR316_0006532 [Psilocybe cubensis]KAH9482002.1 hypothetical protein JR316_0006532 [Psilocybe cubensis]